MIKKSDEIPKKVDYAKLPNEVEKILEPVSEEIKEKARISYDGRQHIVRFPTEISKLMNISIEDHIQFTLKMPYPKTEEKPELKIELMKK